MKHSLVEKIFFAPRTKTVEQITKEYLKLLVLVVSLPTLAGCNNVHTTQALAPAPPERNYSHISETSSPKELIIIENSQVISEPSIIYTSLSEDTDKPKCKINHRFDNKAVVAYEWDRSRIALDFDGIGLDWDGFTEFEQVKLEYRLKFSPEKTKKERCRYPSRWQGLVGSGYNEFFLRDENTVWEELREIRKDFRKKINNYF